MLPLSFANGPEASYRVLCLGAHSDDIEIGCGATLLKLMAAYQHLSFYWVVFGASGQRAQEACQSAAAFLQDSGERRVEVHSFRDGYFPFAGAEIKDEFERLKSAFAPDLIFTHFGHDAHQDHRLISEFTWSTFRHHLILEYEIPKFDGDLGDPNVFVQVDETACQRKVAHLLEFFQSQHDRHWFSADTFQALLRLRGVQCNSPTRYAEAFYGHKLALLDAR